MTINRPWCLPCRQSETCVLTPPDSRQSRAAAITAGLRPYVLALILGSSAAQAAGLSDEPRRANFKQEKASSEALQVADWVLSSGNNRNLSFMIVDKKYARVFVFHPDGELRGAAAVLLGEAVGDDSVPGIGERQLTGIRPEERTTPAGRFVAAIDNNIHGKDILWVDYASSISLHRVVTSNPKERRAQRLATPSVLDNRISYGCINVPVVFFNKVVVPAFKKTNGIVYVLPETRPLELVFASLSVTEQQRLQR